MDSEGAVTPPLARGTLVFAGLTAILTLALAFQVRANRALRAEIARMAILQARGHGLAEGTVLAPVELLDPGGERLALRFDDTVGSVLLFHASGCGACEATAPRWRSALAEAARPDLRVVCVQTDGTTGRVSLPGLPTSLAVPLPPEGWLAALPAVPATLLVDAEGVLVRSWYGELDEEAEQTLAQALAQLGP